MFRSSTRISLYAFIFSIILHSHEGHCSFKYNSCGEESEEFMGALSLFSNQESREEGVRQFRALSYNGDTQAFAFLLQIHQHCFPKETCPYIDEARLCLGHNTNAEGLARLGKVLVDLKRPIDACHFLKDALNNTQKLSSSLEDVEFNYVSSLCEAGLPLRTSQFDPFKEAWQITQKYLHRVDEEDYQGLIYLLFEKMKEAQQERLIHEVGGYFKAHRPSYEKAHLIYVNAFQGTPYLERHCRQRNVDVVTAQEAKEIRKDYKKAAAKKWEAIIQRKEDFVCNVRHQIESFAVQELVRLLADCAKVKDRLKSLGVEEFSKLRPYQRDIFAKHLICDFGDTLFPPQNMDVEEYLNSLEGTLYSKAEKQDFLVKKVFPQIKDAPQKDELTPLDNLITSLEEEKKQEILVSALKKVVESED